jgi:hypothetical protein
LGLNSDFGSRNDDEWGLDNVDGFTNEADLDILDFGLTGTRDGPQLRILRGATGSRAWAVENSAKRDGPRQRTLRGLFVILRRISGGYLAVHWAGRWRTARLALGRRGGATGDSFGASGRIGMVPSPRPSPGGRGGKERRLFAFSEPIPDSRSVVCRLSQNQFVIRDYSLGRTLAGSGSLGTFCGGTSG